MSNLIYFPHFDVTLQYYHISKKFSRENWGISILTIKLFYVIIPSKTEEYVNMFKHHYKHEPSFAKALLDEEISNKKN